MIYNSSVGSKLALAGWKVMPTKPLGLSRKRPHDLVYSGSYLVGLAFGNSREDTEEKPNLRLVYPTNDENFPESCSRTIELRDYCLQQNIDFTSDIQDTKSTRERLKIAMQDKKQRRLAKDLLERI